jgi:hypothetical protein
MVKQRTISVINMDYDKDKNYGEVVKPPEERVPFDVTKKHRRFSLSGISFSTIRTTLFQRPTKKHLIAVSGIAVAVLVIGIGGLRLFGPKAAAPNPEPVVTSNYVPPEAPKFYSPLTGIEVSEELTKRAVTGVMIENSVDARPQAGLIDAGVVFEAIAEGGITRFLALFQEAQPDYIGPIRSARPYYVRWAAGFDAAYTHSGGSPEALAMIQTLGVKDMDHGTYGDRFFDRVSNRYAPHNVYTSMARLDQLRAEKGFNSSDFTPFKRIRTDEDNKNDKTPATSISFDISSPLYDTSYSYNSTTKTYDRTLAGTPHTDEKSGKQLSPKVVVALYMDYSIHPDGVHSVYGSIGSGKAVVFQDGVASDATWEKSTETGSLSIKRTNGKNFPLEPGQIWFTAIQDGRVTYN